MHAAIGLPRHARAATLVQQKILSAVSLDVDALSSRANKSTATSVRSVNLEIRENLRRLRISLNLSAIKRFAHISFVQPKSRGRELNRLSESTDDASYSWTCGRVRKSKRVAFLDYIPGKSNRTIAENERSPRESFETCLRRVDFFLSSLFFCLSRMLKIVKKFAKFVGRCTVSRNLIHSAPLGTRL